MPSEKGSELRTSRGFESAPSAVNPAAAYSDSTKNVRDFVCRARRGEALQSPCLRRKEDGPTAASCEYGNDAGDNVAVKTVRGVKKAKNEF